MLCIHRIVNLEEDVRARWDDTVRRRGLHEEPVTLQNVGRTHLQLSGRPSQSVAALRGADGEVVTSQVLQQHLLAALDLLFARYRVESSADGPRHGVLLTQRLEGCLSVLRGEDDVVAAAARARYGAGTLHLELEGLYAGAGRLPEALELLHLAVPVQEDLEGYAPLGVRELPLPLRVGRLRAGVRHGDRVLPSRGGLPEDVLHRL
mmetsp:Transcript_27637/g.79407  ORF Transcript_27637/g.79407 Transcript_27637/m.79407 type:complete len:206 (+) Transcript_27637:184-801(+)